MIYAINSGPALYWWNGVRALGHSSGRGAMSIAQIVLAPSRLSLERHVSSLTRGHEGVCGAHRHAAPNGAWMVLRGAATINMALLTELSRSPIPPGPALAAGEAHLTISLGRCWRRWQEESPCQSRPGALGYSRERDQGQEWPARRALTSDLRKAVTSRVNDTGPPPAGHGAPFIRTRQRPPTIPSTLSPINQPVCLHNPMRMSPLTKVNRARSRARLEC